MGIYLVDTFFILVVDPVLCKGDNTVDGSLRSYYDDLLGFRNAFFPLKEIWKTWFTCESGNSFMSSCSE